MDNQFEYALPAESITITEINPVRNYLVTVKIADDLNAAEFEEVVRLAFGELGVEANQVSFLYVQGSAVVYTQEVKPTQPEKRAHRGGG